MNADAPDSAATKPKRRRARPSRSRRREVRLTEIAARKAQAAARKEALAAKREAAAAAAAAAEAAKIEERKKQLAELADVQRDLLRQVRPKSVDDYCRSRGVDPDSVPYHPRYNVPGVPPEMSLQGVENICFNRDWPAEYGGLGAYRHLKNYIQITYPDIQWNDFLERMLRSLTDPDYEVKLGDTRMRFVSWVGAGSCVAGHTRIYNPLTGEAPTIQELCEKQISPTVLSIGGAAQANIPFLKGVEPLYEVTLDTGEKFQATASHRVLGATGEFLTVASLRIGQCLAGCALDRLPSISEHGPLVHAEGGRSFSETAQDFRGGYRRASHFYDGQLPTVAKGDRAFWPLRGGAQTYDGSFACLDDLGQRQEHSHFCHTGDLLSSSGGSHRIPRYVSPTERLHAAGSEECSLGSFLFASPSSRGTLLRLPARLRARDSLHMLQPWMQARWLATEDLILHSVAFRNGMVQGCKVQAIKPLPAAPFYDLHVPVWNHYFAEGAFHHNSGKTFAAGVFASCWFQYDTFSRPRSSVTLTSTSKGIIAQRVWPVIQKCYHESRTKEGAKFKWGHLVDSKKMVQYEKGDEKHSICAMAVEPGDLQASLDKIKGRHTERMLLVIDEANSTPQAIFECIPNMLTGVRELTVLVIGNAGSRLDPHGRCCEPRRGWKSITIEYDQWETRGVEQWGIGPGVALHFDGARSPNVLLGKTEHRHIYSFERWQQVLRMGDEYRNTLQHWSQDRGFWPPDGLQTTVFTEALVVSHDGMGKFDWIDEPVPYASLDPAFGGDDCVLRFGLVGLVRGPKRAIQFTEWRLVPFDPESPDAIDSQIAQYVRRECIKANVAPEHFGMDASGTGRGVAAILNETWSTRMHAIEFGGVASDMPASMEDPRAARDVFANKSTELWYVCRDLLTSGQLRGLSAESVKEFCSRSYKFESRRYKLEPKPDMKKRLGYSPDHADSDVVLVEVARRNGVVAVGDFRGGVRVRAGSRSVWEAAQRDVALLSTGDYSAANDFAPYVDT